jgi:hypothetical protein
MLETLFAKDPELLIPIIMAICGSLVGIIAIVAHQWRNLRQAEVEAALKQDMLNRGLSVEEIERVVRASTNPANSKPAWGHNRKDPISDNEYYLVEKLVDEGKSAEEIERIIKAVKAGGRSARFESVERPVC